jgi:hypothetical protein
MSTVKEELTLLHEDTNGYCKGGVCDVTWQYEDVVLHICEDRELSPENVYMLNHDVVGQVCIYINGKWSGYVKDYIDINMEKRVDG